MANQFTNSPEYLATRDKLLRDVEGFSTNIYFDSNGIPTVGTGVALLTANGSINTANLQLIANQLGAASTEFANIQAFAQRVWDSLKMRT